MRKILIATHEKFAQGIYDTLKLIIGKQENILILCAYIEQEFNMNYEIDKIKKTLREEDELIVLTDLFGGSVATAFTSELEDSRIHLITGLNFPMLLAICMNTNKDIDFVIKEGINAGKEGIIYVNEKLHKISTDKEEF